MEQEVKDLIQKHYKSARVYSVAIEKSAIFKRDCIVVIKCTAGRSQNYPNIALRILNKFPNISIVHFTGGWIEGVYTRKTLEWAGYKVKQHK